MSDLIQRAKSGVVLGPLVDVYSGGEVMRRRYVDQFATNALLAELAAEIERLKIRLLSAAGDDLCRLSQEEIKELSSGAVKIPPKEEFLASCERFHTQIAKESGVMKDCMTLAQFVAENERLRMDSSNYLAACGACGTRNCDMLTDSYCAECQVDRLRSLLERVPHEKAFGGVGDCYPNCLRCEIDRVLKGDA